MANWKLIESEVPAATKWVAKESSYPMHSVQLIDLMNVASEQINADNKHPKITSTCYYIGIVPHNVIYVSKTNIFGWKVEGIR